MKSAAISVSCPAFQHVETQQHVEACFARIESLEHQNRALAEQARALMTTVKDLEETRQSLSVQEEKYSQLFSNLLDGMAYFRVVKNPNGDAPVLSLIEYNHAFSRLMDLPSQHGQAAIEARFTSDDDVRELWLGLYNQVTQQGKSVKVERYCRGLDKWLAIAAYCPEPGALATVVEDISFRKEAESHVIYALQEKEVLIKEIHHRVKNNLQVITSLVRLQALQVDDGAMQAAFDECAHRIKSMAIVHEGLYQSNDMAFIDFETYSNQLLHHLMSSCQIGSTIIQCDVNVKAVSLCIDQAIPCGLILNEVITNSIKYAFPPAFDKPALISVYMTELDGVITLKISDNGIGLPAEVQPGKSDSLGMHLISLLSTGQLDGTLSVDCRNGTCYTVTFCKMTRQLLPSL